MLRPQTVPINFSQGLDTKTDPKQVQIGKFLSLVNSVFTTGGLLSKRNGFGFLPTLPDSSSSYVTTFNGDLTAIGNNIEALSSSTQSWFNKGNIQPLTLDTIPIIRNNLNQIQTDSVISTTGLVCTAYTELNNTTKSYKYVVADSITGQNIIPPTVISGANSTLGTPRVFLMANYFVIVYTSSASHLSFIAVSISNPTVVTAQTDISTSYSPSASVAFDGVVLNGTLYLAWNGAAASGLKMAYITSSLSVSSTHIEDAAHQSTIVSVCADIQNGVIWVSYYNSGGSDGFCLATDPQLGLIETAGFIPGGTLLNFSSAAQSGLMTLFYETSHTDNGIQTNFVSFITVLQSTGSVSLPVVSMRSIGLASKAFIISGTIYYFGVYSSEFQSTYFLVNGTLSTSASPVAIAKLAYENGGGYLPTATPSVTVSGSSAYVEYLYKDLIQALADSNPAGTTVTGGVYSQTGINMGTFTLGPQGLITSEIGTNLNITGGFLWAYDGYSITEQGFHLWPDSVQSTANATTGGHLAAQIYFTVFTYEWTDNQGNAFRSAPSIPVEVDLTGSGTSTNTITWVVPTLRITAKIANPVKIVGYRWSTAQQVFYQFTSIIAPVLNSTTTDSVTIVDTLSDASILGNNILYTTGGVIEDIGGPASSAMTLFDDRLWLVDAEDKNLLWYSKQVIEATPVEMSDLLTLYIAPTIGSQGSTGPITALGAMDDKLIIFKKDAIYYINGEGPDNTGANNGYSQPIFITSSVGCTDQKSIVLSPNGVMFQSDKGIWLLGRDLSTSYYIGAGVEKFNESLVESAVNIPATTQIRFNLDTGPVLMYDYYYGNWGTFSGCPGVSSCIYQGLHTFINSLGQVFQETPGIYLDGSNPVLMSFLTGHIQLSGISGYERIWELQLLGEYFSPHLLNFEIGYDFGPISEQATITPTNETGVYGSDFVLGQTDPYGGPGKLEQWRVQPATQKCQAFQISLSEIYDPSFNVMAGEGFSLSAMTCVLGVQRGYRPVKATHTVGTS